MYGSPSALGLGSPLPHLHQDWAHPCHICARIGRIEQVREDAKQNHCIVGLREYPVRDEAEIMRLLEDGTIQPRSPP